MASFTKFHALVEHLAEGVHNFSSDSTCTLRVALMNAAAGEPSASADAVLADLPAQIADTNLTSNSNSVTNPVRTISVSSSGQTTGTYSLALHDLVLTASGGSVAAFRYIAVYNDDPTSPADPLIGYYDYGQDLTLANGESLTIDFTNLFTLA